MQYWYTDGNGNIAGPADEKKLLELRDKGLIGDNTDVVSVGENEWSSLASLLGSASRSTATETCPYCRTQASTPKVCPSCGTPHHHECWQENKGCTVYGCSEAPSDEPAIVISPESLAPPPRSGNRPLNTPPGNRGRRISPTRPLRGMAQIQPPKPNNCLVWSILSTLCCCLPFGVVAIVYACQVDSKYYAGDYAGAANSAKTAQTWCWVSFGIGALYVLFVLFVEANL
jgi:hypothetical protein